VLVDVENIALLMAESDLAIGAAGGTAWERCCLGLPALVVVVADNQIAGAKALEAHSAALLLGDADSIPRSLPAALSRLTRPKLRQLTAAASGVTDGCGVARVVAEMETLDG
jgi:spore coat polysaccharide biosynthesis predicted glycosyltransferase SpsG